MRFLVDKKYNRVILYKEVSRMAAKEHLIAFKLGDQLMDNLQKLSKRLNYNQSETVRLALQRMIEEHLGVESDLIVIDRCRWGAITKMLSERLAEEIRQEFIQEAVKRVRKSPEIQKLLKLAKEGKFEIIEKP